MFSPNFFNEVTIGFNRIFHHITQQTPYDFSDIGVNAPAQVNDLPDLLISGCCEATGAFPVQFGLNTFTLRDSMSYVHGKQHRRGEPKRDFRKSVSSTNPAAIRFGITSDLVQLAPGCTNAQLATSGAVSNKLNNYFNVSEWRDRENHR